MNVSCSCKRKSPGLVTMKTMMLKMMSQRCHRVPPLPDRVPLWHHLDPGGGGRQRRVGENLPGHPQQVSFRLHDHFWCKRNKDPHGSGVCACSDPTGSITTLWRSALVWAEPATRSSSCSCTGERASGEQNRGRSQTIRSDDDTPVLVPVSFRIQ